MLPFVTSLKIPATHWAICHLDMDKGDADCNELIARTAMALNGETLKLFCLSSLRNNVEAHLKHVIDQWAIHIFLLDIN
jgi:hypothetical protein